MTYKFSVSLNLLIVFFIIFGIIISLSYLDKKNYIKKEYENTIFSSSQALVYPIGRVVKKERDIEFLKNYFNNLFSSEYYKRYWIKVLLELEGEEIYKWENENLKDMLSNSKKRTFKKEIETLEFGRYAVHAKKETISYDVWEDVRDIDVNIMDLNSRQIGNIKLYISEVPLKHKITNIRILYLAIFILSLLIVMVLAYFLAIPLSKPVSKMAKALDRLKFGNFDEKMDEVGVEEVKEMAKSFNILQESLKEKAKLTKDLLAAKEIQMGLLPKASFKEENFEIWGISSPAKEVGGDFYFWHKSGDLIYTGVGDLSGKGMDAAILASLCLGSLKTILKWEENIEEAFKNLNNILFEEFKGKHFLCLNSVRIEKDKSSVYLINAGQCYPILIEGFGKLRYLNLGNGDLPLGAVENISYRTDFIDLKEGQGLILYSDGGPEVKDKDGNIYGFDNFLNLLKETMEEDLESWGMNIIKNLSKYGEEGKYQDDITILFVKFGGRFGK